MQSQLGKEYEYFTQRESFLVSLQPSFPLTKCKHLISEEKWRTLHVEGKQQLDDNPRQMYDIYLVLPLSCFVVSVSWLSLSCKL